MNVQAEKVISESMASAFPIISILKVIAKLLDAIIDMLEAE